MIRTIILGSIVGSPHFGKLPYTVFGNASHACKDPLRASTEVCTFSLCVLAFEVPNTFKGYDIQWLRDPNPTNSLKPGSHRP